ncbi:MAG: hypothetical protein Q9170_005275 [Blastenia crenularia]
MSEKKENNAIKAGHTSNLVNYHTSLTLPLTGAVSALTPILPIRWTRLLPTASTAPIGFIKLGPLAAVCSTLNKRILVPFQTPTVPFCTTISEAKMKPQSSDSYQPSASGVQENKCIRGGEGSI